MQSRHCKNMSNSHLLCHHIKCIMQTMFRTSQKPHCQIGRCFIKRLIQTSVNFFMESIHHVPYPRGFLQNLYLFCLQHKPCFFAAQPQSLIKSSGIACRIRQRYFTLYGEFRTGRIPYGTQTSVSIIIFVRYRHI